MSEVTEAVEPEIPEELAQYQEEPETAPEPAEEPVEGKTEAEPEADPVTEKAMKAGWRPKEEFEGDPDEWVDAGEFVRRQPLFQQIKAERKRAKDLEKKVEAVSSYAKKAAETARAQVLKELEAKRRQAVEDGDVEAFQEADKEYVEAQKEPEPETSQDDEVPTHVKDFAERNSTWFEKDWAMTDDVVKATQFYIGQGQSHEDALKQAETDIKRKYSDRFENPNKQRPSPVSPGVKEQRPAKVTYNDLTSEQKTVYSALKGQMSLDEYIDELKKQGEFDAKK